MKKIFLIIILLIAGIFSLRFLFGGNEDTWICENGQWIKHGNPSAPKPTGGCGELTPTQNPRENQIEKCQSQSGKTMRFDEAMLIGEKQCLGGKLDMNEEYFCNDYTGTWWIGFLPDEVKEGCNPACVVDIESETAEINWRCTGLIEEN